jgi:uncharacterized protein YbjT (DUF2867 family)
VDRVEVVEGDVTVAETLGPAVDGVEAAYYLVHSMRDTEDYHQRDLSAARNFSQAASAAGVDRIIYLGGLGDPEGALSTHLRSRHDTGDALRAVGIPVTEFRAAIVVGPGSVSFEMIRYLTERLPLMICPWWVYSRVQPIAVRNLLEYLVGALEQQESAGQIVEIGGADVLTYGEMMTGYAEIRGLRRLLLSVPVLTPRLSAYWVHWVTPIPAEIARPLIQGLRNEVVVRDDKARRLFPRIRPMDYRTSVQRALRRLERLEIETAWSDALSTSQGDRTPVVLAAQDGLMAERRQRAVEASQEMVYDAFAGLGGNRGWLYADWAWRLRGELDRLIGGVGLRRGRRHPDQVRVGDAVDFWRVESDEPGHLLRLRAEMRVPGRAWLQFEAHGLEDGGCNLIQTAFYAPKGLAGLLYWYLLYPAHAAIFAGMVEQIGRRAEEAAAAGAKDPTVSSELPTK